MASMFLQASYGQVINKAYFIVKTGTNVFVGKTFNNKTGAILDNSGNIHYNADLINNGTMTLSANANTASGTSYFDSPSYSGATVNAIQQIYGTTNKVVFGNLTLNMTDASSKGVLVADNMELVVEKSVTLTAGDLRLTNEAQLIQLHTGVDVNSGTKALLRDQQGKSSAYTYNDWSSPVGGATAGQYSLSEILYDGTDASINAFIPMQVQFISGNGYNGIPAVINGLGMVTTPLEINRRWLYKFDNKPDNDYNSWAYIGDTGTLLAGEGYTMKGDGATTSNQNYVFKGKPNDGDINLTLSAGNDYLVGNPYPSAIDGNAFINDNLSVADGGNATTSVIDGTLYFWDHFGGGTHYLKSYDGGYGMYTKLGGTPAVDNDIRIANTGNISPNTPKRYIPVAQGFFVVANSGLAGSGTITFKNSQRIFKTEASGSSLFLKPNKASKAKTTATTNGNPAIRLQFDSPDGWHRELLLGFNSNTTDHFDIGYDGELIEDNPEDMYWLIDSSKYVIQGVKDLNLNRTVPLGLKIDKAGIAGIKIKKLKNIPSNTQLYIKDNATGQTSNLKESDYQVSLASGLYNNRFSLVFKPTETLNVTNEVIAKDILIYYSKENHAIEIKNNSSYKVNGIELYNYLGQTIKVWHKNLNNKNLSLPVNSASGLYILTINTTKGQANKKVIIE